MPTYDRYRRRDGGKSEYNIFVSRDLKVIQRKFHCSDFFFKDFFNGPFSVKISPAPCRTTSLGPKSCTF